ncbi:glycoside hydrolase family 32 protein [Methylocapsa sp. S129]|uniref:glycoside hydrolase family 32 protein n=1 Tax=Methylocapsa sp. S129 TaxID=1641869 RepID=UPI00131E399D|nr:glycoside hydrolase family 32 protein [Methylocapsa sp. S129]
MSIYRRPKDGVAAGDAIPFAHQGVVHLFHLASPANTVKYPERVRTTWRHACSKDLVEWEELPAALAPGEGGAPDADGAWTGSVIESGGVFHLFYTGHKLGAKHPQTICHATSRDLVHFEKDAANPILSPTAEYEAIDWRDPFVMWNEAEQVFWMLIAARLRNGPKWRRGCIALATSSDLKTWSVEPMPFYAPMSIFCPECPELFQLNDHWHLVYSRYSEDAATICRVSENPRGPWRIPSREAFDGRRWYAAKSAPYGEGRVFFGWVHDRAGDVDTGEWLWGGDFAAPRLLASTPSGALTMRLADEVANAFGPRQSLKVVSLSRQGTEAPRRKSLKLESNGGFAWEVFELDREDYLLSGRFHFHPAPARFGLLLRPDDDLTAFAVVFDSARRSVSLTRWPAPLDSFWADLVDRSGETREVDGPRLVEHPFEWRSDGSGPEFQLLATGSVVEIFVDRRVALSYRIYSGARQRIGVFVEGGSMEFTDISVQYQN